jgi:hypothetical protein
MQAAAKQLPTANFNHLIPRPTGQKWSLGSGTSAFAIQQIIKLASNNVAEAKQLAKHLQKETFTATLAAIHQFIWTNFNNINEGHTHTLQTLSAAYYGYRHKGINCEDATIIALQILGALGIKAYVRKIWQPSTPSNPTHVYVVVPLDQQSPSTATRQSYFVIDGTLPTPNVEANYIKKKDVMAEPKIKYYGMNSPANCGCNNGLNEPVSVVVAASQILNQATQLWDQLGLGWDEEQAFKDLMQRVLTEGHYGVNSGKYKGLKPIDIPTMTLDQVNYWLNVHWPNQTSKHIEQNPTNRVAKRYKRVFESLRQLALSRKNQLIGPATSGNAANGNTPATASLGGFNLGTLALLAGGTGLAYSLIKSNQE